ncbi:MAG: hypothetical protein IJW13_06670 [Clostridia bacterium]|nr:hypothetical protein [Clostridia bacterium]
MPWAEILAGIAGVLAVAILYAISMLFYFNMRRRTPDSKYRVEAIAVAFAVIVSFAIKLAINLKVNNASGATSVLANVLNAVYSAIGGLTFEGLDSELINSENTFLSVFYTGSSLYAGLMVLSVITAKASYEIYSGVNIFVRGLLRRHMRSNKWDFYIFTAVTDDSLTLANSISEKHDNDRRRAIEEYKQKLIDAGLYSDGWIVNQLRKLDRDTVKLENVIISIRLFVAGFFNFIRNLMISSSSEASGEKTRIIKAKTRNCHIIFTGSELEAFDNKNAQHREIMANGYLYWSYSHKKKRENDNVFQHINLCLRNDFFAKKPQSESEECRIHYFAFNTNQNLSGHESINSAEVFNEISGTVYRILGKRGSLRNRAVIDFYVLSDTEVNYEFYKNHLEDCILEVVVNGIGTGNISCAKVLKLVCNENSALQYDCYDPAFDRVLAFSLLYNSRENNQGTRAYDIGTLANDMLKIPVKYKATAGADSNQYSFFEEYQSDFSKLIFREKDRRICIDESKAAKELGCNDLFVGLNDNLRNELTIKGRQFLPLLILDLAFSSGILLEKKYETSKRYLQLILGMVKAKDEVEEFDVKSIAEPLGEEVKTVYQSIYDKLFAKNKLAKSDLDGILNKIKTIRDRRCEGLKGRGAAFNNHDLTEGEIAEIEKLYPKYFGRFTKEEKSFLITLFIEFEYKVEIWCEKVYNRTTNEDKAYYCQFLRHFTKNIIKNVYRKKEQTPADEVNKHIAPFVMLALKPYFQIHIVNEAQITGNCLVEERLNAFSEASSFANSYGQTNLKQGQQAGCACCKTGNLLIDDSAVEDSEEYRVAVLGFGSNGQNALNALYQNTAYVGKNGMPSQFVADVYDPEIDNISGKFAFSHPGYLYVDCGSNIESKDLNIKEMMKKRFGKVYSPEVISERNYVIKEGIPQQYVNTVHGKEFLKDRLEEQGENFYNYFKVPLICFHKASCFDYRFMDYLDQKLGPERISESTAHGNGNSNKSRYKAFIIALGDDELNISMANSLLDDIRHEATYVDGHGRTAQTQTIYINLRDKNNYQRINWSKLNKKTYNRFQLLGGDSEYNYCCKVVIFGSNEDIYSYQTVIESRREMNYHYTYSRSGLEQSQMKKINGLLDKLIFGCDLTSENFIDTAISISDCATKQANYYDMRRNWLIQSVFRKQSNKDASRFNTYYKQRYFNATAREVVGGGDGVDYLPDFVMQLAKTEHERWIRFHLSNGWFFSQKRRDVAKEHNCICPYSMNRTINTRSDILNVALACDRECKARLLKK